MNRRKVREKSKEEAEKTRQRMVLQKFILQSRKGKGMSMPQLPAEAERREAIELDDDSFEEIDFVEVDNLVDEKLKNKNKDTTKSKANGKESKRKNSVPLERDDGDEGDLAVLSSKPSTRSLQTEMLRNRIENFPFDRKVLAELPLEIQEEVFAEYERLKEGAIEFDVEDVPLSLVISSCVPF